MREIRLDGHIRGTNGIGSTQNTETTRKAGANFNLGDCIKTRFGHIGKTPTQTTERKLNLPQGCQEAFAGIANNYSGISDRAIRPTGEQLTVSDADYRPEWDEISENRYAEV